MRNINFVIEPIDDDKLPVYRRIADAIERDIRSGVVEAGTKLPTVRELSTHFRISNGTAIRTYEHLERRGLISMNQGKGTFALDITKDTASRKEKAVKMIDKTIIELEKMGFSAKEIEIFFGLIMREHTMQLPNVKLAVIDCNPETLYIICAQLRALENAEIFHFLLNTVQSSSFHYDENMDLVITTSTHYAELSTKIRGGKQLLPISLSPSSDTVATLAQIPAGAQVGIVTKSERFSAIVKKTYTKFAATPPPALHLFEWEQPLEAFIADKEYIVVPLEYAAFCTIKQADILKKYERDGGRLVLFNYQVDKGSLLHVQQEVNKCYKRLSTPTFELS